MTVARLVQIALGSPPEFHIVEGNPRILLSINESKLFAIPDGWSNEEALSAAFSGYKPEAVLPKTVGAISLNLAQTCNLSCAYCYADEGRFGGKAQLMSEEVALRSIDRLIADNRGGRASIGFIGGEPLLNRDLLHLATQYAAVRARQHAVTISFGITTNATLLRETDLELFRRYCFAVTVSLDGSQEINDECRRAAKGSAFQSAILNMRPLLDSPGGAKVGARCTVTALDLRVAHRVEEIARCGFSEVGVSPLRTSPDPHLALKDSQWAEFLNQMCEAANIDWARALQGQPLRFSNFAVALKQLDAGVARSPPCGAAANYVSVDAEGDYFTCHRTVGQPRFRLGGHDEGPEFASRQRFVESRQVDRQEPCRSCWARYLCGGGCHAEVITAGRSGCAAILGWLEFCIGIYPEVLRLRPDLLGRENERPTYE